MKHARGLAWIWTTAVECTAVIAWMVFEGDDRAALAVAVLAVGEVLESQGLFFLMVRRKDLPPPARRSDRVRRHLRFVRVASFTAMPFEIATWLAWLWVVVHVGPVPGAVLLLVLMHLKHTLESAAVRGIPYLDALFELRLLRSSFSEAAGAVAALALIQDDHVVAGAAALVAGIGLEHWWLLGDLLKEYRLRDIRVPRPRTGDLAWRSPAWRRMGFANVTQIWAASHLRPVWRVVAAVPFLRSAANRYIINSFGYRLPTRPDVLSTIAPYTSWASLTDRTYSARHLAPEPRQQAGLPRRGRVVDLFATDGQAHDSSKSTLLFPLFAQWFVDGFLRTDPADHRRNTSTHDIDLSQLYGQTSAVTDQLRTHKDGALKAESRRGQEFPPRLLGADGRIKPEFSELRSQLPAGDQADRKGPEQARGDALLALALPRGNLHYGLAMMSTLFLREHNRLARAIRKEHRWDDEQIFQTARNTLTVMLLKIVIEDYINHITPFHFRLSLQPGLGAHEAWNRQNWMSIEFNLLYRWHALVPNTVVVGGRRRRMANMRWDMTVLHERGIASLIDEASRQPSSELGLHTTPRFLLEVERATVAVGREVQLASYNDYREACGYPRARTFADVTVQGDVRRALERTYRDVDRLEFYVGLFAEDVLPGGALPALMGTMVGCDAFTQALTNPLLAERVFVPETFSDVGWREIARTSSLQDLARRNVPGEECPHVSLTRDPAVEPPQVQPHRPRAGSRGRRRPARATAGARPVPVRSEAAAPSADGAGSAGSSPTPLRRLPPLIIAALVGWVAAGADGRRQGRSPKRDD